MAIYGVWMDHDHAKVLNFKPNEVIKSKLDRNTKAHHTGHHENEKENHIQKFYHDLVNHLKDADQVLIMGPGLAKTEFVKHVESHHHKEFRKKIVGVESADHLTDGEFEKKAREFFTKRNLFN